MCIRDRPSWMPLATLLNCSSLIPLRVIHMPIGERQQQAEPTCHAARRYITIGRPSALPADFSRATLRTTNRLYRRMRIGAAQRKLSRNHREPFWHRTTLEPHARSGSAGTATRCSPREPAFGTRATIACGGLKKSVRVRWRMGYPWPKFWTIRGRSSSLFSRRATRPPRGPYEVLGACRFT